MRYLPLTDADRGEMLSVIGAPDVDALFADVPAEIYLKAPIEGLPMHASEMAVERHMRHWRRRTWRRATRRSSAERGPIATMCPPASIT